MAKDQTPNDFDGAEIVDSLPAANRAVESLPPNLALMKMENDQIFSLAVAHPRDYAKITEKLCAMVKAYPEAAEEAIYAKPVGSVVRVRCQCGRTYECAYSKKKGRDQEITPCQSCGKTTGPWNVVQKIANNLSIRAAESIRQAFGFNRVSTQLDSGPNGTYKITASFIDYCEGNVTQDERLVSQYITGYNGNTWKISDDRFFGVTVEAEKAKARRNAILGGVNAEVKAAYYDFCEKTTRELLTDEKMQKIVAAFSSKGITAEQLETRLGQKMSEGWTVHHREELAQIWNAIKSGEANPADFFGKPTDDDEEPKKPTPPSSGAGASASDFTSPKTAATKEADKEPQTKETAKSGESAGAAPAGSAPGSEGAPPDSKPKKEKTKKAEKPKAFTLAIYQEELAKVTTKTAGQALYDRACGPESTWSSEDMRLAAVYWNERSAALNAEKPAEKNHVGSDKEPEAEGAPGGGGKLNQKGLLDQ